MENSGGGITFTEKDLEDAKNLIGLLNKAAFKELSSAQILQASSGLVFLRNLLPKIEENIFEIKEVIDKKQVVE